MKKSVLFLIIFLTLIIISISIVFAAVEPAPVAPKPDSVPGTECGFFQKLFGNCPDEEFKTSCIDYDKYNDVEKIGSVEYSIKGDKTRKTIQDECVNENIVTEYYCREEWEANFEMIPVNFQNKNCPSGFKCQKGYCSSSGSTGDNEIINDEIFDDGIDSGAENTGIGKNTYHSILLKCGDNLENSWSSPNCLTQEQLQKEAERICSEGNNCRSCKQNFCQAQPVNYLNQCPLVTNYKYKFGNYKCGSMSITVGDGNCYSKTDLDNMANAKCSDFCKSKEVLNYCPACKLGSLSFREECGEGDETPMQTEQRCSVDSDCVAAECCHANSAVNKKNAPKCLGVACTKSCEGALDCGKAKPACINNKCVVLPLGGKCENVKCVSYSPVSNCGSCDTRCINENELKGLAECKGPLCPKATQAALECACDPNDGLCKGKNEINIDGVTDEDKETPLKPYIPWSCSSDADCPEDIIGGYSEIGDTILRFKPCVNGKCPMSVIRSKDAPETSDEISEKGCDENCVAYQSNCKWQCVKESEVSEMQKKDDKIVQVCSKKTEAPKCSCSNNMCVQRSDDEIAEIPPGEIPIPEIPEEPSPIEEPKPEESCPWWKKLLGVCSGVKPTPVPVELPEGALFIGNAPLCDKIGSFQEGWYNYVNGKNILLKFAKCKGCKPICKLTGQGGGKGTWFDCNEEIISKGAVCYFPPICDNVGKSMEGWYSVEGKRLKSDECEGCMPKCRGGRWIDCNEEVITNEITCDSFAEACPIEIDDYVCKKYGGEWNKDSGCLCENDKQCNWANGYLCRKSPEAKQGYCVKAGICQAKKIMI